VNVVEFEIAVELVEVEIMTSGVLESESRIRKIEINIGFKSDQITDLLIMKVSELVNIGYSKA